MVLERYLADDASRAGQEFADYVSVESVVAQGVISHLALTGKISPRREFSRDWLLHSRRLDN